MKKRVLSPFWLIFAAIALSPAWLLPNHSWPWLGFHGDAWAALILLIVSTFVMWRNKFSIPWHGFPVALAFVAAIPLVQYATGLIPIFGIAWINGAYLLGFLLAVLVGAAWEQDNIGQCADYLFLAIGIASILSVGLQLHQFFDLDAVGPWILASQGSRHFANMAQPNLLASLLLIGVLGCGWGYFQGYLGAFSSTCTAGYLLIGVALTESRTGWLNIMLIVIVIAVWRKALPTIRYLWTALCLAGFFLVLVLLLPYLTEAFGSSSLPVQFRSASGDPRWTAWAMFLKAAVQQPILGFGWGQLALAQWMMLDERIALGGSFLQAHNLIIDLILWNGIPIGLAIAAFLTWWCWTTVRRVENFLQLTLMSFLMVLGTHAMLEYPLQYAYFLLPAGLVVGCLNTSLNFGRVFSSSKALTGAVFVLATVVLAITIRDYFRVETSFYGLRFEQRKIATPIPPVPPDVMVLTQWHDYILFARMEPRSGVSPKEIEWLRGLVATVPSAYLMYRFAYVLVLNDQTEEAQQWLKRICLATPASHCEAVKIEWAQQALLNNRIAAVPWPIDPK